MNRISTAFRAFFQSLFHADVAQRVESALAGQVPSPASVALPVPTPVPQEPPKPAQSEALTLLASLQREARLVDFLMEDLAAYQDEQVGAAVREIHRDSAKVLQRVFALQPIVTEAEGATIEVPANFDAGRYRLTGRVGGTPPFHGALRHHGWEATQCDLPTYTGSAASAKTLAPAEVEIG